MFKAIHCIMTFLILKHSLPFKTPWRMSQWDLNWKVLSTYWTGLLRQKGSWISVWLNKMVNGKWVLCSAFLLTIKTKSALQWHASHSLNHTHKFAHRWRRLPCKVPTPTVWGSVSCSKTPRWGQREQGLNPATLRLLDDSSTSCSTTTPLQE